jgi:hypothetical protein
MVLYQFCELLESKTNREAESRKSGGRAGECMAGSQRVITRAENGAGALHADRGVGYLDTD